jgi:hypothetical protein
MRSRTRQAAIPFGRRSTRRERRPRVLRCRHGQRQRSSTVGSAGRRCLEGRQVRVPAVHPGRPARVEPLPLRDHRADVVPRAALVARAPQDDARVVAVAGTACAPVQVGVPPLRPSETNSVAYDSSRPRRRRRSRARPRVDVLDVRRVVGRAHGVDVELLHRTRSRRRRLGIDGCPRAGAACGC